MAGFRFYSKIARCTAPIVLILACAGCWEKIEYKGPRTTSAPAQPSAPSNDIPAPPENTPPTESPVASANVTPDVEPHLSPPPAPLPDSTPSPPVDDRYGTSAAVDTTPPKLPSEASPSTPPPNEDTSTGVPGIVSALTEPARPAGPTPRTEATSASATTAAAPTAPALDSRRAAWLLGSWMSLAALANDRGVATKNVPAWLEHSRKAARFLGTTVPELPEPASSGENAAASKQVINYLLVNGQRIGSELSKRHTAGESALFEVALKSNILLVLYTPGTSAGDSIALAISQAAPKAQLPAELWQPVVDAIQKQAGAAEVRAAVQKMHVDVDQYLSQRAEPKG